MLFKSCLYSLVALSLVPYCTAFFPVLAEEFDKFQDLVREAPFKKSGDFNPGGPGGALRKTTFGRRSAHRHDISDDILFEHAGECLAEVKTYAEGDGVFVSKLSETDESLFGQAHKVWRLTILELRLDNVTPACMEFAKDFRGWEHAGPYKCGPTCLEYVDMYPWQMHMFEGGYPLHWID